MGELIRYDSEAWEGLKALVLDSVASPHSKRAYSAGLDAFLSWYRAEFRGPVSKAVVHAYKVELERSGLSASTINQRLAAIRKLVSEAADNGLISGELAAGVAKVKGAPQHGIRIGNWLDRQQAEQLLNAPNRSTITGKRDRAILAVLIGRVTTLRGSRPRFPAHSTPGGSLGNCRPHRETWTYPFGPDAR